MHQLGEIEGVNLYSQFINALNDFNHREAIRYSENNPNQAPSEDELRFIASHNHRTLIDLLDIKNFLNEDGQLKTEGQIAIHQRHLGIREQEIPFWDTFSSRALSALKYIKTTSTATVSQRENLINNLCIKLIGMKPLGRNDNLNRTQKQINEHCEDTTLEIGAFRFRYADYKDWDYEKRICLMTDFINCANSSNMTDSCAKKFANQENY